MFESIAHRLVALPWIYDAVQNLAGAEKSRRRIGRHLAHAGNGSVLDVGAGTGNYAATVPAGARYIWLDNDPQKLQGFQAKRLPALMLLADASQIALRDKSVDCVLCVAMAHHLADAQVLALMSELARVCRHQLIFVDPVERRDSFISRLLWRYDRGSYPRLAGSLKKLIQEHFEIQYDESYAIWHQYFLCSARPKG